MLDPAISRSPAPPASDCLEYLLNAEYPAPCFVIDEERLLHNMRILDAVQKRSGAKILLALKSFAAWSVFPLLSSAQNGPLFGVCASSVDEARLGWENFGGEVHAFAAAWSREEIHELMETADHITFNSLAQWRDLREIIFKANAGQRRARPIQCGFRVNPEHSEGAAAIYNPCAPGSRLGIRQKNLAQANPGDFNGISGLHFHTLCEQGADALARTLGAFGSKFSDYLRNCRWLNFGGGHHITKENYDLDLLCARVADWRKRYNVRVYLEPGEAVALNAGWLAATVLDIVEADMPAVILDVSAACHMPDVLEMPYRPDVWHKGAEGAIKKAAEPGAGAWTCRLAGKSCLAGDVIGEYAFDHRLERGEKIIFADMAIYSMVKTNTFNGLRLPAIAIYGSHSNGTKEPCFKIRKSFTYEDFKCRLS